MKLSGGQYAEAKLRFEQEYWCTVIARANGVLREAARLSGISPATVHRRIKESGLEIHVSVGLRATREREET